MYMFFDIGINFELNWESWDRETSIFYFLQYLEYETAFPLSAIQKNKNKRASAGNRTRDNCLEGNYVNHYTTDALTIPAGSFVSI